MAEWLPADSSSPGQRNKIILVKQEQEEVALDFEPDWTAPAGEGGSYAGSAGVPGPLGPPATADPEPTVLLQLRLVSKAPPAPAPAKAPPAPAPAKAPPPGFQPAKG